MSLMNRIGALAPLAAALAVPVLGLVTPRSSRAQVTLNNVTTYKTTASGNFEGTNYWDTGFNNNAFDIFAIRGTDVINGAILNAGASSRSLFEALTTNGTVTYTLLMEPGSYSTGGGLTLFFNGATTPQITTYLTNPFPQANLLTPTVATNSNTIYNPFGGLSSGSNSLSFTSGGVSVTLTGLRFFNANVDRVNSMSLNGSPNLTSGNDLAVQFTLNVTGNAVTAAPEPGALPLLAAASLPLLAITLFRRRRA